MNYDTIVVLDFGSQYNQLIVRRLREIGVYAELWQHDVSIEKLSHEKVKGIILSGGPQSVTDHASMGVEEKFWDLEKPMLGICYGMQLMVQSCGGKVTKSEKGEYGASLLYIKKQNILFEEVPHSIMWMSHQDDTEQVPDDWDIIASTDNCEIAAVSQVERKRWGIQFHPEVSHSVFGMSILENFVKKICDAALEWNMRNYIDFLEDEIRTQVGNGKVICGLSGGVDSAVTAAILQRAIGSEKLYCIYVDHGLMRANETEDIEAVFKPLLGDHFYNIDASERFFSSLAGVSDPERKRKIIGHEFIAVFEEVASRIQEVNFLAQGTLYTDIVESGKGGGSHTIKSHHNVGGLPDDMKLELVEPLRRLYKDEVRVLGTELGLSDAIVHRQPFPGPGLAIRMLGEVTKDKTQLVQATDLIVREEVATHGLDGEIWQFFTVLPGIHSVGVRGDSRSYQHAIIIRAVCSVDGMTASVAKIPYDVLQSISSRITNEVEGINRVLYDITEKPPSTIEYE